MIQTGYFVVHGCLTGVFDYGVPVFVALHYEPLVMGETIHHVESIVAGGNDTALVVSLADDVDVGGRVSASLEVT